ncbi:MAG TPA: GGDEF domain-containing protein [Chloroflexus aurantiacus]|uniref:Diguanylate cyclase n=1 Tax=Chloroflexus aurantiacus (strain ATCC 29366 / DSM 635 / J-10-fl) TaxID=324602 RepID=A9WJ93_CHLAA|nr:GGDEF domain-containing protein [Chloroflexus aurantiacus]ABY34370.1 diguanylate cyclase [Chloroflexus aurantiacus J-10-fl]HBW65578.1 GGDEF domain-containing protein [Chloroflexus aurantiacus]
MPDITTILRRDPNTGTANLLAFAEWLAQPTTPCGLIDIQLPHPPTPATLRWLALLLREELAGTIYQPGNTQFVIVVPPGAPATQVAQIERLQTLLHRQAQRLDLSTIPVIRYHHVPADSDPATILQFLIPDTADPGTLLNRLIAQLAALGATLNDQHQFDLDPVTGLPNSFAARQRLEELILTAQRQSQACSVLLMNGDDLRRYNEMSYAAGDQMIRDLATVLREQLRPSDFLARWQTGDQFLAVLPNTGVSGAAALAERLRQRVIERSQLWPFPVTISVGIASIPQHGHTAGVALQIATTALLQAKAAGKNRIVVGRPG